ncbi:hypothetical protein TNIN_386961 [Trichonephila inaurata madagascariensis]|uniref:Uncharacterized protein n=1 Tax=Trichonephila inaurata madagascariensis TaxID=2747483 RepID=A0A8X6WSV9_9ARAC|nr:hypothetical protein TNIN_386961 [Trichonephila inaurata madagascariensis]
MFRANWENRRVLSGISMLILSERRVVYAKWYGQVESLFNQPTPSYNKDSTFISTAVKTFNHLSDNENLRSPTNSRKDNFPSRAAEPRCQGFTTYNLLSPYRRFAVFTTFKDNWQYVLGRQPEKTQ